MGFRVLRCFEYVAECDMCGVMDVMHTRDKPKVNGQSIHVHDTQSAIKGFQFHKTKTVLYVMIVTKRLKVEKLIFSGVTAERIIMVTTERGYCNWEYTGEYETNKKGSIRKTEWKTDCGKPHIGQGIIKSEKYSDGIKIRLYQQDKDFQQTVHFAEMN